MSEIEKRMMNANIKLQDENSELKFTIERLYSLLENIQLYIQVNQNEDGKVNGKSISEMIGEYYER